MIHPSKAHSVSAPREPHASTADSKTDMAQGLPRGGKGSEV